MRTAVFTDHVVNEIIDRLASFEPERGAALLAAGGLVHRIVEDAHGEYTGVSWTISAELTLDVQRLEQTGLGRLAGTVHTHPAGTPDPSHPDLLASARLLDANPHLDSTLIAVVTRGHPRDFDLPIGPGHRMSLHLARRQPHGRHCFTRIRGRVTSVRADLDAAPGWATAPDQWFERATPDGPALCIPVVHETETIILVDVHVGYPHTPPSVSRVGDDGSATPLPGPMWLPGQPTAPQVRAALASSTGAPVEHAQDRTDGLTGILTDRRALIAGLGSVGSMLATELARAGVGSIALIDPDVVEPSNLARSVYTAADIGVAKTTALSRRLRDISPSLVTEAIENEVGSIADLAGHVASSDLVVAATDDAMGQALLSHHAYAAGTPMIAAGLYRHAAAGEIVLVHPAASTPCWACAVGGARGVDRPNKDYGTGRLVSEIALGPPIRVVTEVAAQLAIGMLAGPQTTAGLPVAELLAACRTLGIVATAPGWGFLTELFADVPGAHGAPQSVWPKVASDPACPVCGERRIPPAAESAAASGSLRRIVQRITRPQAGTTPHTPRTGPRTAPSREPDSDGGVTARHR